MSLLGPKVGHAPRKSREATCRRKTQRVVVLLGVLVVFALGLQVPGPALARSAEQAELVRLDEDLRKLAGRNAWEGVEGVYARLRGLEAKGVQLTLDQHALGAQAALQLGHIREARGRFGLARASGGAPADVERMATAMEEIDRKYSSVQLSASGRSRKDVSVVCSPVPFATDARAAIQYATDELRLSGSFDGLLPLGSYTLGASTFVISPGGALVKADAVGAPDVVAAAPPVEKSKEKPERTPKPAKEKPERTPKPTKEKPERTAKPPSSGDAASGFYVGLSGGSATWAASGLESGFVATPGTGANLQLAGGALLDVGPVGVIGELGWTGMFGGGGTSSSVQLADLGGGVAVGGDLQGRFTAQLGLGWASVAGLEPGPACAQIGAAGDATCLGSPDWQGVEAAAFVVSPGGSAGLAWRPSSSGQMGVTLDVGLRSVFGQLIPWTGLGAQFILGR